MRKEEMSTELTSTSVRDFPPPAQDFDDLPKVGDKIRLLRTKQKLSLVELGERSGVSAGLLSQIERDLANPSLKTLTRIRQALGVPLSALFDEGPLLGGDPAFVRRKAGRPKFDLGPDRMVKELLSSSVAQNLQFMILHIPPGGNSGPQPLSYASEKAGIVLEGEFALRVDDSEVRLQAGDSFQFDGLRPHYFRNASDEVVRVVLIIGPTLPERHL